MILVFGGTTEGRKAAEVLEEAGSPYYYSTRSERQRVGDGTSGIGQQVELVHGTHLTGDLDVPKMIAVCREHDIRLIVDAAHPFAEELHRNLLFLAKHLAVPIIRYDRIYPKRDESLVWCKDYQEAVSQLEAHGVERLLALTGVNTIGKLRDYWLECETADWRKPVMKHECWFRILNRRSSKQLAMANQFPEERLVYYEHDETAELIERLKPDAIITKESGESGGFAEKVETARRAGLKVFVVERPEYPPHTPKFPSCARLPVAFAQHVHIEVVNGPYGLRRTVERLLPEFFPLHSGLTTGTCATAAAVADAIRLLRGETPSEVPVILPNGETIPVAVGYGDGYAFVIKDAGNDPDVTNGLEIRAAVERLATDEHGQARTEEPTVRESPGLSVAIIGGEGVGRFTLPGFDYPPGEAAINKAPREMIRRNLEATLSPLTHHSSPLRVTISVPHGAETARRTFNPRLGIEGGISIIGVSGIVKPFSEEAFIESIRKCMEVAKASGTSRVVINSGGKSERFVKALYPELPQQAFVEYGNYIGATLEMADGLGFTDVTLGVMLGKAVKLAQGHLDTHSRRATMDKEYVAQLLKEAGITLDISDMTLARELWERIPQKQIADFCRVTISRCYTVCRPKYPTGNLTILLIADDGTIHSQ